MENYGSPPQKKISNTLSPSLLRSNNILYNKDEKIKMLSAACCMPVVRQKDIFFPFHAAHYSPEPLSTSTTRDNNEVLTVAPSNDI